MSRMSRQFRELKVIKLQVYQVNVVIHQMTLSHLMNRLLGFRLLDC